MLHEVHITQGEFNVQITRALLALTVITQLTSTQAFAWGGLGHRTSGVIAEAYMTPQALAAVQGLLQGQHLGDIASWADFIKKDPTLSHTGTYHYENIPDGKQFLQNLATLPPEERAKGGVVSAILVSERQLEDPSVPMAQKQIALKFLVHFIGDLHQPLHAGRATDRGGNDIRLNWYGTPTNLHAIWDSGMMMTGHADLFNGMPPNSDYSVPYARYLMSNFQNMVPPPQTRDNPLTWLMESMAQRVKVYDPLINKDQDAYTRENLAVMDLRVKAAGMRIADVLNRIFSRVQPPREQMDFMAQMEKILGPLKNLITLGPRQPSLRNNNNLIDINP